MNGVILGGVGVVSAIIVVFTANVSVAINTVITNVSDVVKTTIECLIEK